MAKNETNNNWENDGKKFRRHARDQMREWVGDLDHERLDELEETDDLDQYIVFEKIRQKKKPYFDD